MSNDTNDLLDCTVAVLINDKINNLKQIYYGIVLCYDSHFETYTVQFDDGDYMNRLSKADVLKMIEDFKLEGIY
jgi:hypothetical protein